MCVCVCVCVFNESQAMLLQNVQATEAYNPEQNVSKNKHSNFQSNTTV